MKFFCKNDIVLAMASGIMKSSNHQVIVGKTLDKKCQWSGCATPDEDVHSMKYEGEIPTPEPSVLSKPEGPETAPETTTSTETSTTEEKPVEEAPQAA